MDTNTLFIILFTIAYWGTAFSIIDHLERKDKMKHKYKKKCDWCGKFFEPSADNKMYCENCDTALKRKSVLPKLKD